MTEREKYLYDIQGYLVVRNFLSADEVARLNAAFDANQDKMGEDGNSNTGHSTTLTGKKRGFFGGMLTWEHPWCDPFRDLLAHPKAIPYLNEMHGRGWRMDHTPFALFADSGTEGLILHGPGHRFDGSQYYILTLRSQAVITACGQSIFRVCSS